MEKVGLDSFLLTISGLNRALVFLDLPNEQIDASEKYPPPGSPDADTIFSNSVYERGALTLHALRLEVGDKVFFEILQTYTSRYQYSNVTTDDFIAVAEEISGQDLGDLFQAWLFEEDIPDIPELDLYREDYTIND